MSNKIQYYREKTSRKLFSEGITIEKAINDEFKKLNEWTTKNVEEFDIFLSHSYLDKQIIYGIYQEFIELGFTVYVDWIHDKELDRSKVNKETAAALKKRMIQSKCLFYATSNNSQNSKWMPWELGYMDGLTEKVVIFPLLEENEYKYKFPEYLALYNYVERKKIQDSIKYALWVFESELKYVKLEKWLTGVKPYLHK